VPFPCDYETTHYGLIPNLCTMPLSSPKVRFQRRTLWYVAFGFGAVVFILLVSGVLLLRAIQTVGIDAERLSDRQLRQVELIDKLQYEQAGVGELLYEMEEDSARRRTAAHRQEARRLRSAIDSLSSEVRGQAVPSDQANAWSALESASQLLFASIDAALSGTPQGQRDIALNHRRFVATVARLLDSSYQEAQQLRSSDMRRFSDFFARSAALLGGAVALAIAGTVGSIVFTFRLFGALERESGTLRDLALHILDEQEQSARRFSLELHDEFGQTLNAIEATLSIVHADSPDGEVRLADARSMVKDSIANAREMARLLRPSILDDFGLDAGLRELARGFSQRTGIVVDYTSTLRDRLSPQIETHMFRIAQEALTNVSRHSSAKRVSLRLKSSNSTLVLRVVDDGAGMPASEPSGRSLGLIGMAERANALGGRITIRNAPPAGVEILVEAPLKGAA
jgi:signal transduction histidine kinase